MKPLNGTNQSVHLYGTDFEGRAYVLVGSTHDLMFSEPVLYRNDEGSHRLRQVGNPDHVWVCTEHDAGPYAYFSLCRGDNDAMLIVHHITADKYFWFVNDLQVHVRSAMEFLEFTAVGDDIVEMTIAARTA